MLMNTTFLTIAGRLSVRTIIVLAALACTLPPAAAWSQVPASTAPSACAQTAAQLQAAVDGLNAYAARTRSLIAPALQMPGDGQQKAYESFNASAERWRRDSSTEGAFSSARGALLRALEKGALIDPLVVEYAEWLGAYRSELQAADTDPLPTPAPGAAEPVSTLYAETLKHAGLLRAAVSAVDDAAGEAATALAAARKDCRP